MKYLLDVTGGMIIREGTFIWQKIVSFMEAENKTESWKVNGNQWYVVENNGIGRNHL